MQFDSGASCTRQFIRFPDYSQERQQCFAVDLHAVAPCFRSQCKPLQIFDAHVEAFTFAFSISAATAAAWCC